MSKAYEINGKSQMDGACREEEFDCWPCIT